MRLTKSHFLIFREEPIHFWASLHNEETTRHFSEFQQHLAIQGQITEKLAKTYLEQVILPRYDNAELLWQPEYTDGEFYAKVDALIYDKSTNSYDLYEIKATTSPDNYLDDIAFQQTVCEATIYINRAFILHLNKAYHRSGNLDLSALFTVTQMDEPIKKARSKIKASRDEMGRVAKLPNTNTLVACTKPNACPCKHLCHPALPKYPIYDLPYISRSKITALRARGITSIKDIPADFSLSEKQRNVVDAVQAGQPFIDKDAIQQELAKIIYPIAFLDYEAVLTSIPKYDGYYPNQNMAFQYSLHILENETADLKHYEFLGDDDSDPARSLVEHLAASIPNSGSIIVWNKSYEGGINKALVDRYPDYRDFALALNDRIYDLMQIFSQRKYIHPDFHGSASIKHVLPILVPLMTYKNMLVAHGGQAVQAWNELTRNDIPSDKKNELRRNMLAYCKQDTLAMVEIYKVLRCIH